MKLAIIQKPLTPDGKKSVRLPVSVPLNASFSPHNRSAQRVLNYSAIFDEIEDFEANIRNVSGPGALAGGALDPNHGLLIGDAGDLNVPPSAVNAFSCSRPAYSLFGE